MPSLLAADAGALGAAVAELAAAGAEWAHVDVFDGSLAGSNGALSSMGPATVAALKRAAPRVRLDVHLGVGHGPDDADAMRDLVAELAAAGADRLTFQYEPAVAGARDADAAALALARAIGAAGCRAGVALAPATPAAAARALVDAGAVDLVDVLAVAPGRGGQKFRADEALAKVRELRAAHPALRHLMVDGGIDAATAPLAAAAGANVLVAGSFLFPRAAGDAPRFSASRFAELADALTERGV